MQIMNSKVGCPSNYVTQDRVTNPFWVLDSSFFQLGEFSQMISKVTSAFITNTDIVFHVRTDLIPS